MSSEQLQSCSHLFAEDVVPGFRKLTLPEISKTIPSKDSYADPDIFVGPHGELHVSRLIFGICLAAQALKLDTSETQILFAAAHMHDSRRTADDRNRFHGYEAADWWKDRLYLLPNFPMLLNGEAAETSLKISKYHETRDEEIPERELSERERYLLGIFKLCDALDRYRDPDPARHINFDRFEQSDIKMLGKRLAPFMYSFVKETEHAYMQIDAYLTVVDVGRKFGLVELNPLIV